MTEQDLESQIEELFSDTGLESGADPSELIAEEAVVDLLTGEPDLDLAKAEVVGAATAGTEALPSFMPQPAGMGAEGKTMEPSARPWNRPLRGQRAGTSSILLHSVTMLGAVLLVFLLIRLVWREPMPWSTFQTMSFAAYVVAIVITLIQWMFNASLSKALRQAEEKRDEAVRSQAIFKIQADELAAVNAPLQKRVMQLETAVQIAQTVASTLDPGEVMQRAVNLVQERFGLFHVSLFLTDESRQWAVLRASTAENDPQAHVLASRVKVGDNSTVGQCTANAQVFTAPSSDATSSRGSVQAIPTSPRMRSEVVLPLESRGQVIGALQVQSIERDAFPQEDIALLQTVAQQIAIAIDNARSIARTPTRSQTVARPPSKRAHEEKAPTISPQLALSYERTPYGGIYRESNWVPGEPSDLGTPLAQAMEKRQVIDRSHSDDGGGEAALLASIKLRGEALGVLGLHEMQGERQWTDDEVALLEAIADQMALAIENARLLEETQQRAEREQTLSQVTARFTRSLDVDTLLQTAVKELGQILQVDETSVYLGPPPRHEAEEKGQ